MSKKSNIIYSETLPFTGFNILFVFLFLGGAFQFIYLAFFSHNARVEDLIVSFIVASIFLLISLNFYSLKIFLTKGFVEARFGIFSRQIKYKQIITARTYKYKFTDFWGWGIRRSLDGKSAYNVTGDNGTGIMLTYKEKNKDSTFFFSAKDTDKILNIIKKHNASIESDIC